MKKICNVFDYLTWRSDLSFTQASFTDVDNLLFSLLAYQRIDMLKKHFPISLKEALTLYHMLPDKARYLGVIIPQKIEELSELMMVSKRFSDVMIYDTSDIIDEALQMQFSASTFLLPDHTLFIAFRGTDDTLIGWKEDLNMSFASPVPAQTAATKYLESISSSCFGYIRLGGHSKGGNLAQYAAIHASARTQNRILAAYSNDGPGFEKETLQLDGYRAIRERLITFVPKSSVVGMLFDHDESYITIQSNQNGILQHDPFSWEVKGSSFVPLLGRSEEMKRTDAEIRKWISGMPKEKRQRVSEIIYEELTANNVKTLTDLSKSRIKTAQAILRSMKKIDRKTQLDFLGLLGRLFVRKPFKKS